MKLKVDYDEMLCGTPCYRLMIKKHRFSKWKMYKEYYSRWSLNDDVTMIMMDRKFLKNK